jgi:hypothetical protein
MTEPSPARPIPGPPRHGPSRPGPAAAGGSPGSAPAAEPSDPGDERAEAPSFDDLEQRPVAEHVGVFEAEHARLQRELGTIDRL